MRRFCTRYNTRGNVVSETKTMNCHFFVLTTFSDVFKVTRVSWSFGNRTLLAQWAGIITHRHVYVYLYQPIHYWYLTRILMFLSEQRAPFSCPIRADGTLHSVPSALLYMYFVWQYLHFRTIEKTIYVVFKNVHNYLYLWTRYISCEGWNLSIIVQLTDDNIEKGRNSKKFGSTSPRWSRKIWPNSFMHVNTFL